jgi:hypothetical protein
MSPLTQQLTRSDSIAPGTPGSLIGSFGNSPENTNPLTPGLTGGPPGGIHRGSINGIPGGGLPGAALTSRSPVKESSFLARSASIDEHNDQEGGAQNEGALEGSVSPPTQKAGIPIRR